MARKPRSYDAKFFQTLVFSGEPQLILLSVDEISWIIAVAVVETNYQEAFFGAKVTSEQLYDYINERFDLRYLMERPAFKDWYLFDLGHMTHGIVPMIKRKLDQTNKQFYLPGHGIFAREHTEEFLGGKKKVSTKEVFNIDGSWDLPEFSQFYHFYTDLYVVYNSVDVFLDKQSDLDDKRKIQDAFNKPWQGGGSYGSFYENLLGVQSRHDRLRVGGIQYNSPGHVEVRGKALPFDQVRRLVKHYDTNKLKIDLYYKKLHDFLSKQGLLRLPASEFVTSGPLADDVKGQAQSFAQELNAIPFDTLMAMSFNDQLIAAKVLLSIARRLQKMLEFFAQGRVSFSIS